MLKKPITYLTLAVLATSLMSGCASETKLANQNKSNKISKSVKPNMSQTDITDYSQMFADYLSDTTLLDNYIGRIGYTINSGLDNDAVDKINALSKEHLVDGLTVASEQSAKGLRELQDSKAISDSQLNKLEKAKTDLLRKVLSWRDLIISLNYDNASEVKDSLTNNAKDYQQAFTDYYSVLNDTINSINGGKNNGNSYAAILRESSKLAMKQYGDPDDYKQLYESN